MKPETNRTSLPSRADVVRRWTERGGRIAAVYPIHSPRALLRAFDLLPMEVWGPPGVRSGSGDAHLQAYTCPIVRAGLSFLLDGGLAAAEVVVVPHGCDSLQGLGSVLSDFLRPAQAVVPFYLPRQGGEAALAYFAEELKAVYARLAAATGRRPDAAALREAIAREEAADALFAELLDAAPRLPFAERDTYRLIRSREFLPAEDFAPMARAALQAAGTSRRRGIPVVLSGVVPEPMEILDAVEAANGVVVADDTIAIGRRRYPPGRSDEPFRRMAESLLASPPDSTRGASLTERIAHLQRLAASSGARAVVFYEMKFCEPEGFFLPELRRALESSGLKSVVIEADLSESLPHQAVTRLEALLETLS